MTDKEQIMIDGVDVSECVSFDKLNGQNICCYEDTREDKIPFANFCVENKDCYFKQLARKTQECEEYKKRAVCFKDVNKQLGYKYLTIKQECEKFIEELRQECEELENEWLKFSKECEELKKQLKTSEKWRINAESLNEKLDIKNTRYRKALEEIEELTQSTLDDFEEDDEEVQLSYCHDISLQILDIINKAKGSNNDR